MFIKVQRKARITKCKVDATKVVAKLGPVLIQVELLLRDKQMSEVPTVLGTKLKDLAKTMRDYNDEAKKKLGQKAPLDMTFSLEDVLAMCKEANGTRTVVNSMLNSIRAMQT